MDTPAKAGNHLWKTIAIGAGICALAFLIVIQPSYLAYALGGVLCGVAIRWWIRLLVPWRGKASVGDALLALLGFMLVLALATVLALIIGAYKALTIMTVAV